MTDAERIDMALHRVKAVMDKLDRGALTSGEADKAVADIINTMPDGSTKAILRGAVMNKQWLK